MRDVVLDAGALIVLERGSEDVRGYVLVANHGKAQLFTSSGVVAQVWRGGARQARLSRLLASDLLTEVSLGPEAARRIGILAAAAGLRDVVDGHVAAIALERDAVVLTSDPDDISRWGVPSARIIRCR